MHLTKTVISPLTYKIIAYAELDQVDSNESVDWAWEMIELGFESPGLFMLAGFTKPTSYFEVVEYVKDSIKELGFEMKYGEDAIVSYASYYVSQIAQKMNVRRNLDLLYEFCRDRNYETCVYDFYLLYWAWSDLDYDDAYDNHYWPDVKRNNIEDVVIEEAKKWLAENMPLIERKK